MGWVRAVVVGLAALAQAAPAAAERIGVVVVAAADPPAEPAALAKAVERAARGRGDAIVPDALDVARARHALGAGRRDRFARATELAAEGWRAYLAVRPAFAAERLAEARSIALEVLDLESGPALLADVALRLGVVELGLGRAEIAAGWFALAGRLAPARAVTDAEFKPEVVAAYERARSGVAGRATLSIVSQPDGAALQIDGVAVGTAPIRTELEPGPHAILARTPGGARALLVEGGAAGELRIEVPPDPTTVALRRGVRPADGAVAVGQALDAIRTFAELDAVWLVAPAWRRGAGSVLAQRCAGAPLRCAAVVEVELAGGLDRAARALLGLPRRPVGADPAIARLVLAEARPRSRPVPVRRPLWRRPWLWVGAAGVAAAVTGVVLLAQGEEVRPVVEVDPGAFRAP